jgi:hypothetical protein
MEAAASSRAESLANRRMGHALIGMTQAVKSWPASGDVLRPWPSSPITTAGTRRGSGQRGNGHRQPDKGVARIKKLLPLLIAELPEAGTPLRRSAGFVHHRAAADPGKDSQAGTHHRYIKSRI